MDFKEEKIIFQKELSGGQQQRVGIGRSAVKPELWFLDEPFSALDPLIRKENAEFLKIQNSLKKTIIFITHDFDEAIKLADRIIIMNEGRIVQIGSPEDLIMKPADDYVKEFTEDLPRERLLSVKSIMKYKRFMKMKKYFQKSSFCRFSIDKSNNFE